MPAGLPPGRPGIDEEIDGAIQQAAQPGRHSWSDSIMFPSGNVQCRYAGNRCGQAESIAFSTICRYPMTLSPENQPFVLYCPPRHSTLPEI
jgi:hypothetical protein